jgi:hypothetical protein
VPGHLSCRILLLAQKTGYYKYLPDKLLMTDPVVPNIFISYAHADEDLKIQLDKHLVPLKRSGKVSTWNDRKLIPGQEWDANIILLLISIDFIASQYIWDEELAVSMSRHEAGTAHVVPVILKKCLWQDMPFAKLQALPKNAVPVVSYEDRDEAFTEIAASVNRLVDHMRSKA